MRPYVLLPVSPVLVADDASVRNRKRSVPGSSTASSTALAVASCCMLLTLAPPVRAAEPQRQARVTVFLLPSPGVAAKVTARVFASFTRALQQNPRLAVKDSDKLLVEFAGEMPREEISAGTRALEEGTKLLLENRAAVALPRLEQAVKTLERVIAFIKKGTLAQAMLLLGLAQAEAGDQRDAYQTFIKLLIWRPQLQLDPAAHGARHKGLWEKAKAAVNRRRRGSVELVTVPPGAKAYVDGRFMGVTPTVAFGLPVGEHYASFKLTGFVKSAQKIVVSPDVQQHYEHELRRSEKYLLLQRSLEKARGTLGQPRASEGMLDLRSFLYIDQVIFATVEPVGPENVRLSAYLYDLRSRLRLNQASAVIRTSDLTLLGQLSQQLYFNVRYDGELEAPPEPPPPPQARHQRFYSTWWFWTALGAGAAAVILPIALWPDSSRCPDGSRCVTVRN